MTILFYSLSAQKKRAPDFITFLRHYMAQNENQ